MKYDVFISYSRKDTAIADQICEAFDKVGITYFIDRQGIGGGMEFPKVLAPAIRESEIFLLLASQNAYDSPFTDREITFAFNKKRGEKMLPYIIDDTPFPDHLELIFSSNNWLILQSHPIEPKLVNDVLRLLGKPKYNSANAIQPIVNSISEESDCSDLKTIQGENGKYGFINKQGATIISFEYEDVYPWGFFEGVVSVKKDNKWGFIDKQGNAIIPFVYDYAKRFSEELACVKKADKWGFIDKQNRTIIPFDFDEAQYFSEGLAGVKKDDKYGFIDKQGNDIIPFEFDYVFAFLEGIAQVCKNKKWGFIDKSCNIIIPFEFDSHIFFHEELACVEKDGKYGFIDKQGNIIIPFEYDEAHSFFHGQASVMNKNLFGKEQTFYIDKHGNRID